MSYLEKIIEISFVIICNGEKGLSAIFSHIHAVQVGSNSHWSTNQFSIGATFQSVEPTKISHSKIFPRYMILVKFHLKFPPRRPIRVDSRKFSKILERENKNSGFLCEPKEGCALSHFSSKFPTYRPHFVPLPRAVADHNDMHYIITILAAFT